VVFLLPPLLLLPLEVVDIEKLEESEIAFLSYIKKNKLIYAFILVIFGAGILLAVERRFKKIKE